MGAPSLLSPMRFRNARSAGDGLIVTVDRWMPSDPRAVDTVAAVRVDGILNFPDEVDVDRRLRALERDSWMVAESPVPAVTPISSSADWDCEGASDVINKH